MKASPPSRRYLLPAAFVAAIVTSYAFGYISNLVFSDPAAERAAAVQALAAAQHAANGGSLEPGVGTGPSRVGAQFADTGPVEGGQNLAQITAGEPLGDWLKKLMAQEDDAFRLRHFMRLYDALNTPEDLKAALEALGGRGGGGREGRMEASLLLQKFAKIDPKAALAYAAEARGGERMGATSTIVRTWAKNDPEAALAWAKANVPKAGEEGARRGPGEISMVPSVIAEIAKTDLGRALTEASGFSGRTGGRMADTLAGEMIQQRGADAARNAAASLPEGDFKNQFIAQLAGKLASKDPAGTAAWAKGLAAGDTRSRALTDAVQEWTKKDAAAAGTFVSALPVAKDSDPVRSRYAVAVASKDQKSALTSISGISDPERQKSTVIEVARSIGGRDAAAGQQFVALTSITPQAKAEVARSLTRSQRGAGGFGGTGRNLAPGGAAQGGGPGGGRGGRGGGGR